MRKPQSNHSPAPPQPGEGKRGADGYLGYLLRQASSVHHNSVGRALTDLDITPPQFSVLTMINAYPGLSNADIARLALQTPQTVSVIIANLKKAGLVSRRPHAVHGRIMHLELTSEGQSLLREARRRVHKIERELVRNLPHEHQQIVRHWLVDVATNLLSD
jgi:DNA-binding MarR family transcriptional regulator